MMLSMAVCGAEPEGALSKDPTIPALRPETKAYGYRARHEAVLNVKDELKPDIVFIGDSITHHWGGIPKSTLGNGAKVLQTEFAKHRVLNLGFGHDRTQNALWRLQNGEIDGLSPEWVVINIGSNNTSDGNTSEAIMQGIRLVCEEVRKRVPKARIILMSIFPRELKPTHRRRLQIDQLNALIASYAAEQKFVHLDIGKQFLDANGEVLRSLLPDTCHPNAEGYRIWAKALLEIINGPSKPTSNSIDS